ncbi:hypothetical protein N7462_010209 [Penicillium macrosclerotiorum]|uniref:uncharacterized protein n=1 Tax=Penicillium macrosclerotiorum TaxID=303699 RepID=UPI002547C0E0|nr:uncharacterized protein N7462_010209 [Penicillium macrosclerotiorum]KAJ5669139.1 hypothetical protein N7462_010209 [Penicillium macrosclerotiorum]
MDPVKTKDIAQDAKGKPLSSVEEYQLRWAQLMEDTTKQIQKIRDHRCRERKLTAMVDEEKARQSTQASKP